jgi:RNA polymerase primary sigma factor
MKEEDIISVLSVSNSVISFETETYEDSGTLMDIYQDTTYDPDRELMEKSMREDTMRFLERLLEREKKILMYRFSFYGNEKYTLKRIGDELGISPETVRQIEKRAIKKLKKHADELKEYVYS